MRIKYSYYRDSSISWAGRIPKHWETKRLKHIFRIQKRIVGELGYNVLSITQHGIKVKDITSGKGQLAMDYSKYQRIYTGEFGMNHMDLLTGYVDISKYDGVISPDYRVFSQIDNQSDKNYMLRLLQMCYKQKIFFAEGQGAAQLGRWRMPSDNFKNFLFPVPPKQEQTAIARFLDYKLAKINRFIRNKKQLIKLLNEQKAAIINNAVTKGLDPNVKTKPSGIEWLGHIPIHWEVRKLKFVANCFPSNIDKHSKEDEKQVRLCNYTDVYKNDYITDSMDLMLATATDEQIEKFTLLQGDVVITKDSETANDIAVPAYVKEPLTKVVCGYHLSVLRPNEKLYGEFLFRVLQCKEINIQFEIRSNGVTRVGLGVYDLKNAKVPLPPSNEQSQIVEFIFNETVTINTTISKIEKEIALVEEYKTALISEAVTGKIDVRAYVIPKHSEEETYEELEEELSMVAEGGEKYEIVEY
ncbi:restriction endonuclease subunit S [Sphingobacterium bovisgrunnientis]|uniref:restriction endonuclease subunit S n=1 Tax=Sphingobacterium bovisgrunnientis TaxID=1874697 RepID=UPI00135A6C16|nr:restriction endonuclease subunit S [Sphingobacterium bovisgrunnientis]